GIARALWSSRSRFCRSPLHQTLASRADTDPAGRDRLLRICYDTSSICRNKSLHRARARCQPRRCSCPAGGTAGGRLSCRPYRQRPPWARQWRNGTTAPRLLKTTLFLRPTSHRLRVANELSGIQFAYVPPAKLLLLLG